ncbi:MAG TPA: hypothetical protein VG710_15830 [Opitutus sp.]|nr:hypothetical protein [Opitutus sp.]
MTLTQEQQQAVGAWVAAGDNLSVIQRKLAEDFKISMTYRDVRFLVDDLNLSLKDAAPKVDASDLSKAPASAAPGSQRTPERPREAGSARSAAEKKGFLDKAKEKLGLGKEEAAPAAEEEFADEEALEDVPAGASNVSVSVDSVTLIPGALASGSVAFGNGVTGKWIVDQYGRPGLTEISQPGYRPSAADSQAFMQELSRALQQKGY